MQETSILNKSRKREVKLKEALWRILCGWKVVVLSAVIFTIIGAGVVCYKNNQYNVQVRLQNQYKTQNEGQVADETMNSVGTENGNVRMAISQTQKLYQLQKYQKESVRANLDPYSVHKEVIKYAIETGEKFSLNDGIEKSKNGDIAEVYKNYIVSEDMIHEIRDAVSDKIKNETYIEELINVELFDSGSLLLTQKGITISIYGNDDESIRMMADVLKKKLKKYQATAAQYAGSHTLKCISDETMVCADQELAQEQMNLSYSLYTVQSQVNALSAYLTDKEKQYVQKVVESKDTAIVENDTDNENQQNIVLESEISLLTGVSKGCGIGFVAGILLAAFLFICIELFTKKMWSLQETAEIYGLRMIGDFYPSNQLTKFKNYIDRGIRKLRYQNGWTKEKETDVAVANIKVCCAKANVSKILFVSSRTLNEVDQETVETIGKKLREHGIESVLGENFLRNAVAMEQMVENRNVVMLEKCGQSVYSDIEKILANCEHQADVMGIITF